MKRDLLDWRAGLWLVVLCASWGAQQVAVKVALPEIPPLTQMALRSAGAAAVVAAYMLWARIEIFERDGSLALGLGVGTLFASEFVLIYLGLQWTDASRSAVFIYTAPFFVAIGALWLLPHERLSALQWLGMVASFVGVLAALGAPSFSSSSLARVGDAMLLGAGVLWASTTLMIKATSLRQLRPEKLLLYQLVVGSLIAGVIAVALGEQTKTVSSVSYLALLYQTVWVGGITFLVWFRLLGRHPAGVLQAGTSMTPLFGVVFAFVLLGEPLTGQFALAVVLVVAGLLLLNAR